MTSSAFTSASTWSPLRQPVFRALWIASAVSTVGTWMHDVAAAWLMTSLSPSPLLVAMMSVAASLPFFLLALPAGAIGDVVDRRKMLLITQGWMLAIALFSLMPAMLRPCKRFSSARLATFFANVLFHTNTAPTPPMLRRSPK